MKTIEELANERDKVLDKVLGLSKNGAGTAGRAEIVRYLIFGDREENIPTKLREAQDALLRRLSGEWRI